MKRILVLALFAAQLAFSQGVSAPNPQNQTEPDLANLPFRNPSLPIEQRVDDLVSRLTAQEKVSQMVHDAAAIPRLGIPAYNWWNEGLHGVAREGYATVFPQAIGMAATFDPDLLHTEARAIAIEFRAKFNQRLKEKGYSDWYHGLTVWSPNINIFRDPRWGRGQETYGEDPFLTSQMGVAYVTGLQGNNPKYLEALATPKHFAVHSGPEPTRHTVDVTVSNHDLEDTYMPAFRATVLAGAGSVMCAYNAVDGKPACAQPMLLEEHLRDDWHFNGYVVSDCGAASDIALNHHYTQTVPEGMAAGVKAGMDVVCAWPVQQVDKERDALLAAVQQGLIPQADLDRAVKRLFTARMKLGMFDPPAMVPYSKITIAQNDTRPHQELALRAARESLVLLKNYNHLLPLAARYRAIAVIGPNADSVDPLLGNYNGTPSHPVTVLDGIRKRFSGSKVLYAEGSSLVGPPLTVVPGQYLHTKAHRRGLEGEYFSGQQLAGAPALRRLDPKIDFNFGRGVGPKLKENFSMRWTGTLTPPATGDYIIGFTGTESCHFWLDNQLIGQSGYSDTNRTRSKAVQLNAGHAYPLKLECSQRGSTGIEKLVWHRPGQKKDYEAAIKQADLIVAVLGLTGELEGEEMPIKIEGFSGGDRTSLDLPEAQRQLLHDLVASNKPVVLVLMNGSALSVNWADEHVPAILEAWYPGEEGGTAVAESLAGDFSPSGKLPLTFYKSVDQLPAFDDYNMQNRTYRYFSGEPLYPFGYGLSYTTFLFSDLKFDKPSLGAGDDLVATVDVKNTGKVAGDEVVQLYLTHAGVEGAPLRALAGFRRVHLAPGATETVKISVPNRNLSVVDAKGLRKIVPGEVQVWVGDGQPVTRAGLPQASGISGSVKITGEATLPN